MEIILASGSPRRKELLGLICPDFRVEVSGADEHVTEALPPEQLVARLAEKKASEVASRFPEAAVRTGAPGPHRGADPLAGGQPFAGEHG